MRRAQPPDDLRSFGTASDPERFPELSPMEMLWGAGKQALALAARQTHPKSSEWDTDRHDPEDLSPSVVLGDGDVMQVCIFDEPMCNAFAAKVDSKLVVGVYQGLALVVPELILWLWSNPHFLPDVGDVSHVPSPDARSGTPAGLQMVQAIAQDRLPDFLDSGAAAANREQLMRLHGALCPVRRAAMANTVFNAFRFIWLHEMGHVLFGHVDGLSVDFGLNAFSELRLDGDEESLPTAICQVLEVQADSLALEIAIGAGFARFDDAARRGVADTPFPTGSAQTPMTPRQATITAVLGCLTVPLVLQAHNAFDDRQDLASSHPPLWFRGKMMLDTARRVWGQHPEGQQLVGTLRGAVDALALLHPLLSSWFEPLAADQQIVRSNEYLRDLNAAYLNTGGIRLAPRRHPSRTPS